MGKHTKCKSLPYGRGLTMFLHGCCHAYTCHDCIHGLLFKFTFWNTSTTDFVVTVLQNSTCSYKKLHSVHRIRLHNGVHLLCQFELLINHESVNLFGQIPQVQFIDLHVKNEAKWNKFVDVMLTWYCLNYYLKMQGCDSYTQRINLRKNAGIG